jgi:hypothetical protein
MSKAATVRHKGGPRELPWLPSRAHGQKSAGRLFFQHPSRPVIECSGSGFRRLPESGSWYPIYSESFSRQHPAERRGDTPSITLAIRTACAISLSVAPAALAASDWVLMHWGERMARAIPAPMSDLVFSESGPFSIYVNFSTCSRILNRTASLRGACGAAA